LPIKPKILQDYKFVILEQNQPLERTTMTRSKYLSLLIGLLTVNEIKRSAANPTPYMSKTQVMLHYVALRRLGA
jgi:hypothetical protein